MLAEKDLKYTTLIRKLSEKVKKSGENWLCGISKKVEDVLIP